MDDETFKRESIKAKTMAHVEPERADYWHGYRHGLRRVHFGEQFGTEAEHQLWMTLANSADASRAARGRGYRDGMARANSATEHAIGGVGLPRHQPEA